MSALYVASSSDPTPTDVLGMLAIGLAMLAVLYLWGVWRRSLARRPHMGALTSGQGGAWVGYLHSDDLSRFFPDVREGRAYFTTMFSDGFPVRLELDSWSMRLRLAGRLTTRYRHHGWAAPWSDVVSAEARRAGFRGLEGTYGLVRLTDLYITVVGEPARPFLDSWFLLDEGDVDDEPPTPEDLADEASWLAEAQQELGPLWTPGTALLRIRTSAPEGLVETVGLWARGRRPQQ